MIAAGSGAETRDLVVIGAGTLLLAVHLYRWARGRDMLAVGPPPRARFGIMEALAVFLLGLLTQQFLLRAGLEIWPGDAPEPTANRYLFSYLGPVPLACLGFFLLVRRNREHGPRVRGAACGFLVWLAWFPVVYAVLAATQLVWDALGKEWTDQDILEVLRSSAGWKFALAAVVCAPLYEEVVFRGLLYPAFRRRLARVPAILLVSAVFAVMHGSPGHRPALFVLSIAITWTYERTGTLAGPIAFHAVFNGWTFLSEMLSAGGS